MNNLEQFFRAINDSTPEQIKTAFNKARAQLNDVEQNALMSAIWDINAYQQNTYRPTQVELIYDCALRVLRQMPHVVKDLSLTYLPGLQRMYEQVDYLNKISTPSGESQQNK